MRQVLSRQVVCFVFAATALYAATPSGAAAQSIVDWSKPQTGKSRFVLNPDLTPADLGAGEEKKPAPVAVVARAPACGDGCKMEQPDAPRETRRGYSNFPHYYGSDERTRALIVVNAKAMHDATQQVESRKRSFRFRRR